MNSEAIKIVYFVRHGQSIDNVSDVFQSTDSPLSETGQRQAEVIADRLTHISFDALISSPLQRAKQTAEPIAKHTGKEPEFSDLFVERIKPSSVDGKPYTDPQAAKTYRLWQPTLYTPGARVEDGENYDDVVARSDRALEFLKNRSESSLVVVTHGYFLRAVLARVLVGEELSGSIMKTFQASAETENTGITVLKYIRGYEQENPDWQLWTYNDHAHFAE
jgi:broad specificity phosphatase PhoE